MWCVWTIIFVVATQTLVLRGQDAEKKTVILGGVFSDHPSRSTSSGDEPAPDNDALLTDEQAFMFAVDFINFEMQSNSFFNFQGLVKTPEYHTKGPFQAMLTTCSLISEHAVAIFGPKEHEDIDIVQSICDHKDIAHVITRWMYKPPYQRSIINFYPHSEYLTSAYFSVLTLWEWKSFTLLYEDNESLLRLGDLLNFAKNSGIVVSVKQLSEEENDVYRASLKQAVRSGERNFVIDCKIEILEEVLRQAQQVGMMTSHYNYFITNLDMQTIDLEPFQYSEANITGIRIFDPEAPLVRIMNMTIVSTVNPNFDVHQMKTETALIIDAVNVVAKVIDSKLSFSEVESTNVSCNSLKTSSHGYSISNHVKTSKNLGMTGVIEFDGDGYRSNFNLDVVEVREEGIVKIGTWNSSKGLITSEHVVENVYSDPDGLRNKSFIVITCLTDPYCMLKESSVQLFGNDRFEGFAIDLIHELAVMEGFNYTFLIRDDKTNGAKNETTQKWSGMIGDVIEGTADLAITDLTINAEREEAVDFTSPFMNLGISILAKKPGNAPPSFFSFADPFALDTWTMMALAYCCVFVSFFILSRLCQDEWTNPYPCIEEPEFLINQFTFRNSAWFAVGSLLQQGTEIAPIAIATRMLSGMWWFFVLIMVSTYTANLAAFLATENPIHLFTDVHSLVENMDKHKIRLGAKLEGATETFFKGKDDPTYQAIAQYMATHKDDMVRENKYGVEMAEGEGNYAFFMESISIEYETQRHCGLQQYGKLLDDKGYGIAMRKNSTYRKKLSTAILKLQASGELDNLKRKWWEEKRGGGVCSLVGESNEADSLGLQNVQGVFYVTIFGTILAAFLVVIEMLVATLRISKKAKISFKEALRMEMTAFLNFNSNVKPAIQEGSKSGSKSSRGSKCSRRSKSSNNNMTRPYGFIPTITKEELRD